MNKYARSPEAAKLTDAMDFRRKAELAQKALYAQFVPDKCDPEFIPYRNMQFASVCESIIALNNASGAIRRAARRYLMGDIQAAQLCNVPPENVREMILFAGIEL